MNKLNARLKRLETALSTGDGEPRRKTFDEIMDDLMADDETIRAWLEEHGYANALEAVAAGETGPPLRGHSLSWFAELERDTVQEMIYNHGPVFLWCQEQHGWDAPLQARWCAPINGRLEYLAPWDQYDEAVARFRELTR